MSVFKSQKFYILPEIPIKTPGLKKTKTLCEDLHHLVTTKKSAKLSPEYDEKMLFYDEKKWF